MTNPRLPSPLGEAMLSDTGLSKFLDFARARHEQWLQSPPAQRATLEPAYILGDRKHIPEASNAVESVLRTELLEVIPRSLAETCMRHGYCAAELIVWYIMKQLILPPDVNEVTMQKEILTPPKVSPASLDHASAWLEEMQHRLNLCIKTKQSVHPRTIVAFVNDTLSGSHTVLLDNRQCLGQSLCKASIV